MANSSGTMEILMKENGSKTICTGKACSLGVPDRNMKESISRIKGTVSVNTQTSKVKSTLESG